MRGYFVPREVLVLEAELERAKMYLMRRGLGAALVEANTALLTGMLLKARSRAADRDAAEIAAADFLQAIVGEPTRPA